ncbi:hypothetical protein ACFFRR_010479 [Megaselia abdita]
MSEKLQTLEIPQNYSALLTKLEKLAIDLDVNLENITLAKKEVEISINTADSGVTIADHVPVTAADGEYSRYISDIWIGVILTLLIVSIIFFICSCFLYHKFQQWKNTYHAGRAPEGNNDPLRRFDIDIESLPSYTIVSGLPTYDDALEEFRKAGIILTPKSTVPIIKIFEADSNRDNTDSADSASISSSCVCGGNAPGIIELTPEQLQSLSQKRLSLQISFAPTSRRNSRPRIDLLKQVSRNNMLRTMDPDNLPPGLHRSSSALSLNDRIILDQRLRNLQQHRGSLC